MTTIQLPNLRTAPTRAPAGTCSCGQDLDGCTRAHCPRCGCEQPAQCYAPQLPLRVA